MTLEYGASAIPWITRRWIVRGEMPSTRAEPAEAAAQLGLARAAAAGPATGWAWRAARASARRSRRSARVLRRSVLAARALELAQLRRGGEPLALGARERGAVGLGDLQLGLGQLGRHDLHDRRRARVDQPVAVAVDDVAARRLDADLAHAVLARLGDVVLAGEHLQEPQAEEDDREQHEREAAEHGDAQRELRRDGGAALFERWRQRLRRARAGSARRSCTRAGGGGAGRRAGTAPARGARARRPAARAGC